MDKKYLNICLQEPSDAIHLPQNRESLIINVKFLLARFPLPLGAYRVLHGRPKVL